MEVVAGWRNQLGRDWERTYAVSNSLYVTRQNNVLFTVLAQFMGEKAIGERLLLIETPEFTTTPEKLLEVLARIVSDRGLGAVFFKDYYLMDAELLGSGDRAAIEHEATKRGMTPLLPPLAPFHSNDWPWPPTPQRVRVRERSRTRSMNSNVPRSGRKSSDFSLANRANLAYHEGWLRPIFNCDLLRMHDGF